MPSNHYVAHSCDFEREGFHTPWVSSLPQSRLSRFFLQQFTALQLNSDKTMDSTGLIHGRACLNSLKRVTCLLHHSYASPLNYL
jgi:hypothetical protein